MASDGNGNDIRLQFKPRARLLQLLGDELIGSPRLAVFELVKNAYDADATRVSVILADVDRSGAEIRIEDDGDGMTLATIRDIWLVPGHDHRARQRQALKRTRLGRLPLGEKGVGRFAAHKLGNRIELVTRAAGHDECVVSIDWERLIRKEFLSDAPVSVIQRAPTIFQGARTGTRITITDLRENWSRGEVRHLQRHVTSIASPFVEEPNGFRTVLSVPGNPDWLAGVPDVDELLRRAPWEYRFRFHQGIFSWTYRFRGITGISLEPRSESGDRGKLLVPPEREMTASDAYIESGTRRVQAVSADASWTDEIGAVNGRLLVFDRDRPVLSKLGESQLIRSYLDDNGGIRVYRDGIRVYNYGERDDDWLGLDLRRVNVPARNISRNIVVGAVELSLADSHGLREKTNREGFVENDAQRRLRRIVLGALTPLEVERKRDKDNIRRLTTSGRNPEAVRIRKPLRKLRDAAIKRQLSDEFNPIIDQIEHDYDELRGIMLRAGLSGMGLAIVFHEVQQGVRSLCDLIESDGERAIVLARARELSRLLGGFADLVRKGERRSYSLNRLVRRVVAINRVRFRRHMVRLHCPVVEDDTPEIRSRFVFGLALGALNNLLDNAFYWLSVRWPRGRSESPGPAIHLGMSLDLAEGPAVIVADTGPGFMDEPDEVTHPFFSRRPEGMGVGLFYANMVMEMTGGRLAFPDAREADVPAEFTGAVVALIFPKEV